MKKLTIYTDGACSGNPGPGGWAAVLLYGENKKELSGGSPNTTNNIMEITAVLEALKALKEPCEVELYSDSAYVVNCMTKNWIESWKAKGWTNAAKEPVKNQELWEEMDELTHKHQVHFNKVKGHANNFYNNRCDALARAAIPRQ